MATSESMNPGKQASQTLALNFKLLAHHEMGGFGGVGEGMGMQKTKDGRRVIWLGHEAAPKNFTALDVTDPRNPKMIIQTELPHNKMRSNSLEVCGDLLIVAHQIRGERGMKPAGFDLWDISTPEKPRRISHFDASGPHSLGVHCVWCVDGEFVHMSSGAPDFQPRDPKDHQIYRIVDMRNPAKPVEAGRWWYPGQREGDAEPPLPRHPKFDSGYRPHNIQCLPAAPRPRLRVVHRRRRGDPRHQRQVEAKGNLALQLLPSLQRLLAHGDAAVREGADDRLRRVHQGQRRGLAEADVGVRHPQREEPGADLDAAAAAGGSVRQARRPLRRAQPLRELPVRRARGARRTSSSARSSTAGCAPTTCPTRTSRARSPTSCPARPPCRRRARSRSTTSTSTTAASSTPATASPAGSTCWR